MAEGLEEIVNDTLTESTSKIFPVDDSTGWANNPDPRFLHKPVVGEEVMIEELHEHFVYQFTVFMTNSAGDSDPLSSPVVVLPGTGDNYNKL